MVRTYLQSLSPRTCPSENTRYLPVSCSFFATVFLDAKLAAMFPMASSSVVKRNRKCAQISEMVEHNGWKSGCFLVQVWCKMQFLM